jgi:hypothetical protein
MIVPRALRANYDHRPEADVVPHYASDTDDALEMKTPPLG